MPYETFSWDASKSSASKSDYPRRRLPCRTFARSVSTHLPTCLRSFGWKTLPDQFVVHFYEAAGTNLRERRVPVIDLDAANIEEVAVVVRSAVSALLERSARAAAREGPVDRRVVEREALEQVEEQVEDEPRRDLDEPLDSPVPDHHDARRRPVHLSLGYVVQDYAPQTPWNHGIALRLAWQGLNDSWSLAASYTWFPPLAYRTDAVALTVVRHPAEVSVARDVSIQQSWLLLRPELALGADYVVRTTTASTPGLAATAEQGRWSWSASGRVTVVVSLSPVWHVFATGGVDYLLNRFAHAVAGESVDAVIAPRRLRPRFSCGVGLAFP